MLAGHNLWATISSFFHRYKTAIFICQRFSKKPTVHQFSAQPPDEPNLRDHQCHHPCQFRASAEAMPNLSLVHFSYISMMYICMARGQIVKTLVLFYVAKWMFVGSEYLVIAFDFDPSPFSELNLQEHGIHREVQDGTAKFQVLLQLGMVTISAESQPGTCFVQQRPTWKWQCCIFQAVVVPSGYESKPWHPRYPKIAGQWMFIPPNLGIVSFDASPSQVQQKNGSTSTIYKTHSMTHAGFASSTDLNRSDMSWNV